MYMCVYACVYINRIMINDQTLQHYSNALSSVSLDDIVNDNDVQHSYRKFVNVFFGNL